ncbi:hypothetical protein B0H14DRAFT_3431988 [Mycena olivaceomarginata]|nr:hypothetical protein B0H14DRAFT_3431988 [Mycena olivaceomarginata]
MSFYYNWDIPDVDVPVPPTLPGVGPLRVPIAWNRLKFGPLGLYVLRRHLGAYPHAPGLFQQYRNRFLTSDIAWFAGGLSTDGAHTPGGVGFFPEFNAMHNTLPAGPAGNEARRALNEQMQHAVFDMATLWDHTFGGTTMVLHVDGTTIPGTPPEPQYLRASTYLPPSFVNAHTDSHPAITSIAQLFLKAVGIPTVMQWKENAQARNWLLMQQAHYKFLGRRLGELETILSQVPPAPSTSAPTTGPVPVVYIDDNDKELSQNFMAAIEHAAHTEAESAERLEQIHGLEQQIDILVACIAAADYVAVPVWTCYLTA